MSARRWHLSPRLFPLPPCLTVFYILQKPETRGVWNVAANSRGEGKALFVQRQWVLEYKLKLFFHSCLWLALALTSHKYGRWRKPLFSPHCIIIFILFCAVLLTETKFIFIAVVQGRCC